MLGGSGGDEGELGGGGVWEGVRQGKAFSLLYIQTILEYRG